MLMSSSINMVNGEEVGFRLSAALTESSIGHQDLKTKAVALCLQFLFVAVILLTPAS